MRFFILILALPMFFWPLSSTISQTTLPVFSFEESYQFPDQYEAHQKKQRQSGTVFGKELYVGNFGNEGHFAITRDDGAYDYTRPEINQSSGATSFRLKLPF